MIYLALNREKGPITIREIADQEGIPKNFLEHILLELRKTGLVDSTRGKEGGYRFIESPGKISLARIIRAVEGPLAPLSCVSKTAHVTCPEENNCSLYGVMLEVRDAVVGILERVSLAEVVGLEQDEIVSARRSFFSEECL